ncbi:MAG: chemotaxis protein CheB, partial [Gemmatimonadaceae bacterium]
MRATVCAAVRVHECVPGAELPKTPKRRTTAKKPPQKATAGGKIAKIAPAAAAVRPPQDGFPVAGIGASAGGLEAVTALLGALPDDPGVALVLIQHLDSDHES